MAQVLDRVEAPGVRQPTAQRPSPAAPEVTNASGFVITQAKLLLGQDSDSEKEGESEAKKARDLFVDPLELMARGLEAFKRGNHVVAGDAISHGFRGVHTISLWSEWCWQARMS